MKLLSLFFLLALPLSAVSAEVSSVYCAPFSQHSSRCQISLVGEIMAGDSLFISSGRESTRLLFKDALIGESELFLNRRAYLGSFPQLYPLGSLKGEKNTILLLEISSPYPGEFQLPTGTKVKIVSESFSLFEMLSGLYFPVAFLLLLTFIVTQLLSRIIVGIGDGWVYPRREFRTLFGGFAAFIFLDQALLRIFTPSFWQASQHLFLQKISVSISLWSLTIVLFQTKFSDPSAMVKRHRDVDSGKGRLFSHLALIFSLFVNASWPKISWEAMCSVLALQSIPLFYAFLRNSLLLEWRSILKRSSSVALLSHASLLLAGISFAGLSIYGSFIPNGKTSPYSVLAFSCIFFGFLRMRAFSGIDKNAAELVDLCRRELVACPFAKERLFALCRFLEEEWGASRVSLLSVEGQDGLLLASSGPDALIASTNVMPKRLGPFLRRVCKAGHMLYAPVADELGKDLQDQGLKHSSLAIPIYQGKKIRVVLCFMADEGERISPSDAMVIDKFTQGLQAEILFSVAQCIEEEKNERLLSFARFSDALAIEHMDHWGHIHFSEENEQRLVVGIDFGSDLDGFKRLTFLKQAAHLYQLEVKAMWTSIAEAMEFLPKEVRSDFWVISPKDFRNPYLKKIGAEAASLLLAQLLSQAAIRLANEDRFRCLALMGPKVTLGTASLRFFSYGTKQSSGMDVDLEKIAVLKSFRSEQQPASIQYISSRPIETLEGVDFSCQFKVTKDDGSLRFYSILSTRADRKEVRKIENRSLEAMRSLLKKAA